MGSDDSVVTKGNAADVGVVEPPRTCSKKEPKFTQVVM